MTKEQGELLSALCNLFVQPSIREEDCTEIKLLDAMVSSRVFPVSGEISIRLSGACAATIVRSTVEQGARIVQSMIALNLIRELSENDNQQALLEAIHLVASKKYLSPVPILTLWKIAQICDETNMIKRGLKDEN